MRGEKRREKKQVSWVVVVGQQLLSHKPQQVARLDHTLLGRRSPDFIQDSETVVINPVGAATCSWHRTRLAHTLCAALRVCWEPVLPPVTYKLELISYPSPEAVTFLFVLESC